MSDAIARGLALRSYNRTFNGRALVATKGVGYCQGLSDGSASMQNVTYRVLHQATTDCYDLQFVYGNYTYSPDTDGPNSITVKATLEDATYGFIYPVTFDGQTTVTIPPGGTVVSDPIGTEFLKGATFYSRTYVSVSLGQKYPLGITTQPAVYSGEGNGQGDLTSASAGSFTNTFAYGYSPIAIIGTPRNPVPSIALIGDSIMWGFHSGTDDEGFAVWALNKNFGYTLLAKSGEASGGFVYQNKRHRTKLLSYCTHAIVNYGTNDIYQGSTLSQIQNNLLNIWNFLAMRGIKVYQCTILPKTTSTDNWATVQNQTIVSGYGPGSVRTQLNAWIRSLPAPLSGYFETADAVETARDSGYWKPNISYDGIHPNTTGHQLMAAAINTAVFTV